MRISRTTFFVTALHLALITVASSQACAQSSDLPVTESPLMEPSRPDAFRPERWSKGVHLLAGFGLNSSVYNSETTRRTLGVGLNFKTDVGWYFSDRMAFEIGSAVKFNRSDDLLIWDTLFTLGLRYRFHSFLFHTDGTFVRGFVGESPTVIFLGDRSNPFRAIGASRAQINGPLIGAGGGSFFQTERGLNWFVEWDAAYQWLLARDLISEQKDVPIVVQSDQETGNAKIFSFAVSIGMVLF